jgi:hypothetical protein
LAPSRPCSSLRAELERRIRHGYCVYCRAPAVPQRPLTREHVIPQVRGGGRKDVRIVVPACVDCNRRRGHKEIVPFLLARPSRLSTFVEYLESLPAEAIQQMDPRVFAEVYAAVWLLGEGLSRGEDWRRDIKGRRLHRRRHAARRIVRSIGERLERIRERASWPEGPSCLMPRVGDQNVPGHAPPVETAAGLVTALSMLWGVSAERVADELERERKKIAAQGQAAFEEQALAEAEEDMRRERARRRRVSG